MSGLGDLARWETMQGPGSPLAQEEAALVDLRFRTLVGEEAWARLPEAVQSRFSKRLGPGEATVYKGHVTATELSRAGRVLAFLARAIGGPLPLTHWAAGAAVVIVMEDPALGGQSWTRTYARPGRSPQVVHSAKRFSGPTGLEERVGGGVGMTLRVTVEAGALFFRSERYFLGFGRWRVYLPRWAEPGSMEIVHREDETDGSRDRAFSFRLSLTHPLFGRLLHQLAYFRDS
jgi:hypothetical protein